MSENVTFTHKTKTPGRPRRRSEPGLDTLNNPMAMSGSAYISLVAIRLWRLQRETSISPEILPFWRGIISSIRP